MSLSSDGSRDYYALISSDWNECLAPCGPFDMIAFSHPYLHEPLQHIFREYTGNRITLKQAASKIELLLPRAMTSQQVDAYLKREFKTYHNVGALIQWCLAHDILFMINTTGMIGYFQRVFKKKLLPAIPVLSANPLIRFTAQSEDSEIIYELRETSDKALHTQRVMDKYRIPPERVILMGDSGGDGPHFSWGRKVGTRLIGSMPKASLRNYCRENGIQLDVEWGIAYADGEIVNYEAEMAVDFLGLIPLIKNYI